jgi:hypothetical protein
MTRTIVRKLWNLSLNPGSGTFLSLITAVGQYLRPEQPPVHCALRLFPRPSHKAGDSSPSAAESTDKWNRGTTSLYTILVQLCSMKVFLLDEVLTAEHTRLNMYFIFLFTVSLAYGKE